uniref:Uncharacterized protein n=1 Tax=Mycena chlorophos TaxID=658473 RepID=A0ABQ0MAQ2_MYCCL|nr:predicted protein [Mycena chlorophos]
MARLSALTVSIVGVVAESVLFGVFLVLFAAAIYFRATRYKHQRWSTPLAFIFFVLLSSCTAHWIVSTVSFARALRVAERTHTPFTTSFSKLGTILIGVSVLVGNTVIINRLRVVWNSRLSVMILPVLAWIGTFVAAVIGAEILYRTGEYNEPSLLLDWVVNSVSIVYCSVLIAARLWLSPQVDGRRHRRVAAILVESAAIMTGWTVLYIVAMRIGLQFQQIVGNLTPQIIAIADILIYIRIALGWSQVETSNNGSSGAANGTLVMTSPESIIEAIEVDLTDVGNIEMESVPEDK